MILLLLACANTKAPEQSGPRHDSGVAVTDTAPTDTPSLPDIEETLVEPSLTAAEVGEMLSAALSQMPDAMEVIEAYRFLMTQGDEICPGPGMNILDTWLYGCDATTGYSYAGVSDWLEEEYDQDGVTGMVTGIAGDFWIDTPDGQQLEGGGHCVIFRNSWIWVGEVVGSWSWGGGSAWVKDGYSGYLKMEYISGVDFNMNGAADIAGTHIAATDFTILSDCEGPIGDLSLRDPAGGWHKLMFTSCDPCAQVVFEGSDLGEACVDFAPLLAELEARL
jgi:hypothetical protein